jgi:hypothetical protein
VRSRSAALGNPGSCWIVDGGRPDDAAVYAGQGQKKHVPAIRQKPRAQVGDLLSTRVERCHRCGCAPRVGEADQPTRSSSKDDHAGRAPCTETVDDIEQQIELLILFRKFELPEQTLALQFRCRSLEG